MATEEDGAPMEMPEDSAVVEIPEDAVEAVMKAFENPRFKWRTIRGAAEEAGVPAEIVLEVAARNKAEIVKSSVPSIHGEDLYATRTHFRSQATVGEKILGALKNRIV